MSQTRRELIQLATAALAITQATPSRSQTKPNSPGNITVHTTAGSQRYGALPMISWRPAQASADSIVLDLNRRFQEILGFGAAFTEASCSILTSLSADAREQVLQDLLNPNRLGLNTFRICIGSSDYATDAYTYDEGDPDPDLKRFDISHDFAAVLPVLRQARVINPELFLLASPWTPPGWMKSNNSMFGGSMRKTNFAPYARYLLSFLNAYDSQGAHVHAISVQNEVDTDQDSKMPACLWGQEYETEFIAKHLGPLFAENKITTRIWIIDHNYNLWGRAISELDEPAVNRYVDGVAWHGYLGDPSAMTRVHDAHPAKHMYWTEGGPDIKDPNYLTDWSKWGANFASILQNWSRCIIGWNIVLDEAGKPNIGPFSCGGVLTINSKTREITRSGQYWALAHYSRAFKRGAHRIESSAEIPGVSHVAALNRDGMLATVLTNTGKDRKINLRLSDMEAEVNLPADSVTTLTWRS